MNIVHAKHICSDISLYNAEVKRLKQIFHLNGYPHMFLTKLCRNFILSKAIRKKAMTKTKYSLKIPYLGNDSRNFFKSVSTILKRKFDIKIVSVYYTYKVGHYFQLKSLIPTALCANVVYQRTCLCDMNLTYIGMLSRHLVTKTKEHLNLSSVQHSAVKNHLINCKVCSVPMSTITNFKVLCKCSSKFSI